MMRSSVTSRVMSCKWILAWQGFFVLLFLMIVPGPAVAQLANIALNKPLQAHTNVMGTPEHAVDGDYNTGWYSYQGGRISSISFTVDLLGIETVYGYSLQSLQSEYYIIESSLDGTSWDEKERVDFDYFDNSVRKFEFQEPFQARYIRYTGGNAQAGFAGITEIEIFDAWVFAGGNGSVENPYQIATAEQLDAVRDFLDKHFILTADIDLVEYASGEGWEPIGDANAPFSGSFDGNGHSIINLSINRPDRDHVGLFGNAEGAAFSNLNLQVEVVGDYRVGGLVGNLEPGTISDVHLSGTVTGTTNEVGGLAGRIKFTDIRSSSANVPVSGGSTTFGGGSDLGGLVGNVQNGSSIVDCAAYGSISVHSVFSLRTGGLLGTLWDSTLERSFAAGDVVGRDNVGGLVGYNGSSAISNAFATGNVTPTANGITNYGGLVGSSDSGSTITNTYATGNVTGIDMVGGLIGRQTSDSSVTNSYAAGRVVGTTSNVGGLIGIDHAGGVTSSYYDSTASGQVDTGKGEPKTTAELHQEATFTSWNFDAIWKIIGGATTPYVKWQKYFVFGGTKVQISENVGGVKAGYILRPVGGDNPATRVQSTVAKENATSIEGLQGRWMAVTRAGSNEVRAVAATDAEGESRTWLEVFDAQTKAWEKVSATLALDEDAFEAGNEIIIEEDAKDGLQMRIKTKVTRELHF